MLKSKRPGLAAGVSFRLENEPILRPMRREHAEKLIDVVRDLRDSGNAKSVTSALCGEDLFLDAYLPQLRAWAAAIDTDEEWQIGDPRRHMLDVLGVAVARTLGRGLTQPDVLFAGLAFTPTREIV